MSRHYELTRRRAAAMREMADLGCTASDVSALLDIDLSRVCEISRDFGIRLKKARMGKPPKLKEFILRNARKGISPSQIAERYGTSANSVNATMSALRRAGELPPVRRINPKRISGDLSYFHISSAVNYQKW